LLPSGDVQEPDGRRLDFDAVYELIVRPAVQICGMEAYRLAEHETDLIGERDLEALVLLSSHVVVDLTQAAPHTYFHLGQRDTLIGRNTTLIAVDGARLAGEFPGRHILRYSVSPNGSPSNPADAIDALTQSLRQPSIEPHVNSLVTLVNGLPPGPIERLKTDVFRDRVTYPLSLKSKLAAARESRDVNGLRTLRDELMSLEESQIPVSGAVLIDLLLSFRAVGQWQEMVNLHSVLPAYLREATLVREQYAFASNRLGCSAEAEAVLCELIRERGPSSETCGLLGRVYKDRWNEARCDRPADAHVHLRQAIDAYRLGFESDWRDAYPGINAVTLMELNDPPDPDRLKLLPIVRYAVERRLSSGEADYWDHATVLELAMLARDEATAREAICEAITLVREPWEPETTANNLRLIYDVRTSRRESDGWIRELIERLEFVAKR